MEKALRRPSGFEKLPRRQIVNHRLETISARSFYPENFWEESPELFEMSCSDLSPRAGSWSVSALLFSVGAVPGLGEMWLWGQQGRAALGRMGIPSQSNPTLPQPLPPWKRSSLPDSRATSCPVPVAGATHGTALPSPGSLHAQFYLPGR